MLAGHNGQPLRGWGGTRAWWILAPNALEVKGQLVKVKSQDAQGTSLVVQWLRLQAPSASGGWGVEAGRQDSVPGLPGRELYPTCSSYEFIYHS